MTVPSMIGTLIEYARFAMQMCKVMTGQTCTDLELPKAMVTLYESHSTLHRKFENVSSKYCVAFNSNTWEQYNKTVKSVSFAKSLTIPANAFSNCSALERVDFSRAETINGGAFLGCIALTELNLPNATTIGGSIILNSGVKKISLPKITSIPYQGLCNAPELEEAYLESVETTTTGWMAGCPKLRILMLGKVKDFNSSLGASTELEYLGIKEGTTASLPLNSHPKLTEECLLQIVENYADCTHATSPTLRLCQETYDKLLSLPYEDGLQKLELKNINYEVV